MPNNLLIYLHIPKTAGQTMSSILRRVYYPATGRTFQGGEEGLQQLASLQSGEKTQLQFIDGHIVYGVHRYFDRPVTYLTMLRHPVRRIVSHYYFVKQTPDHYLYQAVTSSNMSLIDYALSDLSQELDNGQTRFLYGIGEAAIPAINEVHYQQAIRTLDNKILCAGIQEQFYDSVLLFHQLMQWHKYPFYCKVNVNRHRPQQIITDQIFDVIAERNQYDMRLYQYAHDRFERQIQQHIGYLPVRRELFKRFNTLWCWAKRIKHGF